MRDIILTVYDYNELDDNAKNVAYQAWVAANPSPVFSRASELTDALTAIKDSIGVVLHNFYYTAEGHSHAINADSISQERATPFLSGVRAGKAALQMHRDITEVSKPLFARFRGADRRWTYSYYQNIDTYKSRADGYRKSGLPSVANESAFISTELGRAFARGLIASVRENYTRRYLLIDHLRAAFDAMFNEVVRAYRYEQTYVYFKANIATEFEYFADGSVLIDEALTC